MKTKAKRKKENMTHRIYQEEERMIEKEEKRLKKDGSTQQVRNELGY